MYITKQKTLHTNTQVAKYFTELLNILYNYTYLDWQPV